MPEHARERPPQPGVRMLVVRQAVGADHAVRISQDPLNVVLVHHEENTAGRRQRLDGILLAQAHLGRDLAQIAARRFRMRYRPAHDDPEGLVTPARRQHGRAGHVGIDIERDRLFGDGPVEERQGFSRQAEVALARAFVVRHHHRHRERPPDVKALFQGGHDRVALVAHVGGMDRPGGRQGFAEFDHLLGRSGDGRGIEQPGAHPDGAGLQGVLEGAAHGFDLGGRGRAVQVVHGLNPQAAVADLRQHVERRRILVQGLQVVAEAAEETFGAFADQVDRRRRACRRGQGRQRDAAVSHHHRSHALARLAVHGGGRQGGAVVVGMDIDEARRQRLAAGVQFHGAAPVAEIAQGDDPVSADREIAPPRRPAAAVDQPRRAEDQVRPSIVGHAPLPLFPNAGAARLAARPRPWQSARTAERRRPAPEDLPWCPPPGAARMTIPPVPILEPSCFRD